MKCLNLFSGKNKKNITNLSSSELAQSVKIKLYQDNVSDHIENSLGKNFD